MRSSNQIALLNNFFSFGNNIKGLSICESAAYFLPLIRRLPLPLITACFNYEKENGTDSRTSCCAVYGL